MARTHHRGARAHPGGSEVGIDQIPCIELAGLSEAQRRAYIIADNKLALNAGGMTRCGSSCLLRDMALTCLIGSGEEQQAAPWQDRGAD
jgi:hypothetical protein